MVHVPKNSGCQGVLGISKFRLGVYSHGKGLGICMWELRTR